MAIDREATLKNAEKFLRVGRLDAAIAEYVRVVDDQPRDWNSANALGDLYMRAGESQKAVALYRRIAEHLLAEGFYPKAAALFKKVLKIVADDEMAQLHLAEISARHGLMADAKAYYTAIGNRRRQRGDTRGADEITIRLGTLDPNDFEARLAGARAAERIGESVAASKEYRELYESLMEQGRQEDAFAALRDLIRCNPERHDESLGLPLLTLDLLDGRLDAARERAAKMLGADADAQGAIISLAWKLVNSNPAGAAICVETAADCCIAAGRFADAAALLQEMNARVPGNVQILLRLVEVCVDGGLDSTMYEAQAQLAEAYLTSGRAAEARVIAEDLVSRNPADAAQIGRLRRALELLHVENIDAIVAGLVAGPAEGLPEPLEDEPFDAFERSSAVPSVTADLPAAPVAHPVEAEAPTPSQPVEIDLTNLLGELQRAMPPPEPSAAMHAPPQDLDDVFKRMRAEAADAAGDESGEYLDLARTYLDMDMTDEAIGSLEMAARSPKHRFSAASMLALIYRDRSDLEQAIEWFERAAEAPAPSVEEAHTLLYDLGDVLETIGETARALAIFLELQADAPGYRDVTERVTRLSRMETEG